MNFAKMRSVLLKVFIGFLSVTAVIAIVSLLGGGFGDIQLKVLITTCSISVASICAMACAALVEKKNAKILGGAGVFIANLAALMVIVGAWSEFDSESYWRITAILIAASVCLAHGCLLCLPNLRGRYRWTQVASTILITLLLLQIVTAIWFKITDETFYRFLAALSVLVVLVTLVIPICSRLGRSAVEPSKDASKATQTDIPEKLVLQKISDGVFADQAGRKFQVTELRAAEQTPPESN